MKSAPKLSRTNPPAANGDTNARRITSSPDGPVYQRPRVIEVGVSRSLDPNALHRDRLASDDPREGRHPCKPPRGHRERV